MALINCPDCNAQVSQNAPTCPSCGAPIAMKAGPLGGTERGVTTRPDFWHDPNVGCLGAVVVLGALVLIIIVSVWVFA